MGDTGSLLVGLINAILVVKFINMASSPTVAVPILQSPAIGFTILMIPLLDTLRVFGIRIIHRRSPFSPDRNHVHHLMLDKGLSHRAITLTLVAINLVFIAATYAFREIGCTWLILSVVAIFFTSIGLLYFSRPKPRLFVAKTLKADPAEINTSKIVPLTKDTILEQKN
jgi:UDP-GlcNAc:undecaprenyl-phosphate/decaprenyl-phosphate GlcNAc-1-phosphate transferase